MPTIISLPDELTTRLQAEAESRQQTVSDLVVDILRDALEPEPPVPSLEDVVARIQAEAPAPGSIHRATRPLADLLQVSPPDPDFDQERWGRDWAQVEAEMKAITRANDRVEGRG